RASAFPAAIRCRYCSLVVVVRVTAAERLGYHRLVCQVPAATLSHATGLWVAYRSTRPMQPDLVCLEAIRAIRPSFLGPPASTSALERSEEVRPVGRLEAAG